MIVKAEKNMEIKFRINPPVFLPFYNEWGKNEYYTMRPFSYNPFTINASSTSGSPVVISENKFFGFLNELGGEFSFNGTNTLTVTLYEGQELYYNEDCNPYSEWKNYNMIISGGIICKAEKFWSKLESVSYTHLVISSAIVLSLNGISSSRTRFSYLAAYSGPVSSSPNPVSYTHLYVKRIEPELFAAVPKKDGLTETIYKAMSYSLEAGGKRLRPVIMLMFAKLFGLPEKEVMPFACAIEMIHTYSLIHDDLPAMDNDDLRRGKPTNHKVFGEAMAILAGDALLNLAAETVSAAKYTLPAERILAAMHELFYACLLYTSCGRKNSGGFGYACCGGVCTGEKG